MADNRMMSPEVLALLQANFPEVHWQGPGVEAAAGHLRVRRLARGATLFSLGERSPAFYGVLSGAIETRFSTAAGHASVVASVEAPYTFGLASFVSGLPSSYEAVATTPARLLVIGPAAYRCLMDGVPGFARALMREFARRFDATMHLLEAARHRGAGERLCLALHHLRHEGRAGAQGPLGPWTMRLTQSELAARANVSRQTANEWLAACAARGWLVQRYRTIEILQWPQPADGGR
jgi:CRP-like cAMP-binding protein